MIKSTIFDTNQFRMRFGYLLTYIFILTISLGIQAQYTESINSFRPGASQGAFSVGRSVIQFETGLGLGREKHNIFNNETRSVEFEYNFRAGLIKEQLEFSLQGSYLSNKVTEKVANSKEDFTDKGFRVNTIGAKYLIYDPYKYKRERNQHELLLSWKKSNKFRWEKLIPAVSAYVGANFISSSNAFAFHNNPDNRATKTQPSITPRFVIAAQNNWTEQLVFVANIVVDRLGSEFPDFRFITTSTYNFSKKWKKWSALAEYEYASSKIYKDHLFRLGGTYTITDDLQLDAHVLSNFKDTPSRFLCNLGVSYRLDYHKLTDDEIIQTAEQREAEKDIEQIKKDIEDGVLDPSVLSGKYKGIDLADYVEEEIKDEEFDSEYDEVENVDAPKKAKWWQIGRKKKLRKRALEDTTSIVTTKALQGTGGRMTDFVDQDFIESKQKAVTPIERTPEEIAEIELRNEEKRNKKRLFKRKKEDNAPLIDAVTGDTIPKPDYSGLSKKEARRARKKDKELRELDAELNNLESIIETEQLSRNEIKEQKRKEKAERKRLKKQRKNGTLPDLNEDYDDDFFNEKKKEIPTEEKPTEEKPTEKVPEAEKAIDDDAELRKIQKEIDALSSEIESDTDNKKTDQEEKRKEKLLQQEKDELDKALEEQKNIEKAKSSNNAKAQKILKEKEAKAKKEAKAAQDKIEREKAANNAKAQKTLKEKEEKAKKEAKAAQDKIEREKAVNDAKAQKILKEKEEKAEKEAQDKLDKEKAEQEKKAKENTKKTSSSKKKNKKKNKKEEGDTDDGEW